MRMMKMKGYCIANSGQRVIGSKKKGPKDNNGNTDLDLLRRLLSREWDLLLRGLLDLLLLLEWDLRLDLLFERLSK